MKIPNNHGFLSTPTHICIHTNKHRNINLEHILDIASFFLICDTQNISNKARHGLFEASNYIFFWKWIYSDIFNMTLNMLKPQRIVVVYGFKSMLL